MILPIVLAAALVAAGCANPSPPDESITGASGRAGPQGIDPTVPVDWHERATPGEGDPEHDHRNRSQHIGLSTPNFEVLGWNPLITDWYGATAGDYACSDTTDWEGRRLTVIASFGSDVAIVIIDVTDATRPTKIGELVMENTNVYDVGMTYDQRYAILGTSVFEGGPEEDPVEGGGWTFRDACSGESRPIDGPEAGLPFAAGVVLVDIQNPRNPFIQDFLFFPFLGGHSIRTGVFDGREIIMASILNPAPTGYYPFIEILDLPTGGKLRLLSVFAPVTPDDGETEPNMNRGGAHDGYLGTHPMTGDHLAYLADGGGGLIILNINDPENPFMVSRFHDWSALGDKNRGGHYVHSVQPAREIWDGRHYTFISEECSVPPPELTTCLTTTIDTTDPANPLFVGAWVPPMVMPWTDTWSFSAHYIDVYNRTLFVTLYHGGMWAVDVSTPENLRLMPSVGVFMPENESPEPVPAKPRRSMLADTLWGVTADDHTPSVEDVQAMPDGTLVTSDMRVGIYLVKFDPTRPAPPPAPWPMGYNEETGAA